MRPTLPCLASVTLTAAAFAADIHWDGGTLDLGNASDTFGDITVTAGDILGTGTLQATSLTVDNTQAVRIGVNLITEGRVTKVGSGSLTLGGNLTVGEELEILSGEVICEGGTVAGNIALRGGSLTGGTYSGVIGLFQADAIGGRVTSDGMLAVMMTTVATPGLTLDGALLGVLAAFTGGPVTVNGRHDLTWWFGANRFEGGLTYGASAVLDWTVSSNVAMSYVDGISDGTRGVFYGAVDVGEPGLVITEGATLRVNADTAGGDPFWFNPRVFKVVGATAPDSITGTFRIETMPGAAGEGWSLGQMSDGLYLYWSGQPQPAAVPEASSLGVTAAALLMALARRRRAQTKNPALRRGR